MMSIYTQTFYAIVKSIWSGTISYIVNIEIYHTSMEYLDLCVVFFKTENGVNKNNVWVKKTINFLSE